jgi:hypothetical protein
MPTPVADQTHWCREHRRLALGAAGLRRIDWARRPAATPREVRPPGARALGLGPPPPARSISRPTSLWNERRQTIWRLRPRRTSAKNWSPQLRQATQRAAAIALNGQRVGELKREFLDRAAAFDRSPGKPVEVRTARQRTLARSTESE